MAPVSIAGLVFAMGTTPVNPPWAAARMPVIRSSLYSWPGSRKCTCTSTMPGTRYLPAQSFTRSFSGSSMSVPTATTRPSRTRTSVTSSIPFCGSITWASFQAAAPLPSPPSSRYMTAMRTATPELTWSRITARSESAASAESSTPRLMGPGCMMIASFFIASMRARLMP